MLTSPCSPPVREDTVRARRGGRRLAVIGLAGAAGLLALTGTASAHVTTNPDTATQGGYSTINFNMPSEEDDASTVSLQVTFPADTPIANADVQPVPGWTTKVDTVKLATPITTDDGPVTEAVSTITWTGKLDPGQFQQFPVSMGPLPTTDQMVFKALQTYSNGDVVRWIDTTPPGGPEPEHPAPVLHLAKAGGGGTVAPAATPAATDAAAAPAPASGGGSGPGIVLGVIGVVLGLIGAVLGTLGFRRSRSGS